VATGAVLSVAIGLPALRIRGLYLAVTTLAFAVALDSYFLNPVNFRDSVPERIIRPVIIKRFDTAEPRVGYYLSLGALVAAVLLLTALRHRRSGRTVVATRDNERSASAFGVASTRTKIQTFVLAGCLAGLAGSLYITVLGGVGLGTFQPTMSVNVFCYAVIGGIESVGGAIAGVALFRGLDYAISETLHGTAAGIVRLSLSGSGLLVVLYFLPGGLWQLVQRARDSILRRVLPTPPPEATLAPPGPDPDDQAVILAAADAVAAARDEPVAAAR
jgi:branched-chain amino acid transport system permease protein